MLPIVGRIGPYILYSFTLILGCGILGSLGLLARQARQRQQPTWVEAAFWLLPVCMISGRFGFVMANWNYFAQRPWQIGQLWQGGLSYHTALAGGLIMLWLWARWQQQPFLKGITLFTVPLALLNLSGWLACWFAGCAFGRETIIGPFSADLPDQFGIFAVRYQTQAAGSLWGLLLLLLALRRPRAFWPVMVGMHSGRLLLTFLRGDTVPHWAGWRVDTLLDIVFILLALAVMLYNRINHSTQCMHRHKNYQVKR